MMPALKIAYCGLFQWYRVLSRLSDFTTSLNLTVYLLRGRSTDVDQRVNDYCILDRTWLNESTLVMNVLIYNSRYVAATKNR